jgi:hypothetical protein
MYLSGVEPDSWTNRMPAAAVTSVNLTALSEEAPSGIPAACTAASSSQAAAMVPIHPEVLALMFIQEI